MINMLDKQGKNKSKFNKYIISGAIVVLVIITLFVIKDIYTNSQYEAYPAKPSASGEPKITAVLWALENDEEPDYNIVIKSCEYIDARYDKSDFAIHTLIRLIYDYNDILPDDIKDRIKTTFLGFKYWMDQPGGDSMCYWSENHQILFAASEYLIGSLYPDEVFTNDQRLGIEHMEEAKERVNIWLEQRWLYGFSEWYSNVYYKEDLLALSQLIDFGDDESLVTRAKIITDLLLYDVASQSYKGAFISTSGRLYESSKKSGLGNRLNRIEEELWDFDLEAQDKQSGLDLNFIYINDYKAPEIFEYIAKDTDTIIIKASNGLDVSELEGKDLLGLKDNQIMMQWGMEAFTNPEVINNSLEYIGHHEMFTNEFLSDFAMMNIGLVKNTPVLPFVSDKLNLKTNGVALQRANTYTYKTNYYMLATAQSYHPGSFGDQQHIWTANLANDISVFTTHPASPLGESGALSGSPNYWVGSGRFPHSGQTKNINLSLYVLPDSKGLLEDELLYYTHAYFQQALMDQVVLKDNYIFGEHEGTYIAMIGKEKLNFLEGTDDDLIQEGQTTYWITELSDETVETFETFMNRIKQNQISFEEQSNQLIYYSSDQKIELNYQSDFIVNDRVVDTEYKRFESPYIKEEREPETMLFEYQGHSLFLDFYNYIRRESAN